MGDRRFPNRPGDRGAKNSRPYPPNSPLAGEDLTAVGRLEIHENDVGTTFLAEIEDEGQRVDVSRAEVSFIFQKPDGSAVVRPGEYVSDGGDGEVRYAAQGGDLDQAGEWKMQVRVEFDDLTIFSSDWKHFTVHPNLPVA